MWAIFQTVVTLYIWFFVPEKSHDKVDDDGADGPAEEEEEE